MLDRLGGLGKLVLLEDRSERVVATGVATGDGTGYIAGVGTGSTTGARTGTVTGAYTGALVD